MKRERRKSEKVKWQQIEKRQVDSRGRVYLVVESALVIYLYS